MASDLTIALKVSESGLNAHQLRMRVIAENLANQHTMGVRPGDAPYQRRVVTFGTMVEPTTGAIMVDSGRIVSDRSDPIQKFDPKHPVADAQGYVLMPNINSLIENADMRDSQRIYEANIGAVENTRQMIGKTLDLLR